MSKIEVGLLRSGAFFVTCITGRAGTVLENDGRTVRVELDSLWPRGEAEAKNLHPNVIVHPVNV